MRSRTASLLVLLAILICLLYAFGDGLGSRGPATSRLAGDADETDDPFPFEMEIATLLDSSYQPALIRAIDDAQASVDVSMFLAQEPRGASLEIMAALLRARDRGVAVRALFEDRISSNRVWAAHLLANGIEARLDSRESKLHDKAVLIDGQIFIAGSHNWSNAVLTSNREASLYIAAEPDAFRDWRSRFEREMEKGDAIPPHQHITVPSVSIRPRVSPTVQLRLEHARGRVVADADYVKASEQVAGRMHDTFLAALYYISRDVLTSGRPLARFFDRIASGTTGSRKTVILDQMERDERELEDRDNTTAIAYLSERGITARYDAENITHHVKAMVLDERYVLLGSHNWTISSVAYNRETSILVDAPRTARVLSGYIRSFDLPGQSLPSADPSDTSRRVPMDQLIRVH